MIFVPYSKEPRRKAMESNHNNGDRALKTSVITGQYVQYSHLKYAWGPCFLETGDEIPSWERFLYLVVSVVVLAQLHSLFHCAMVPPLNSQGLCFTPLLDILSFPWSCFPENSFSPHPHSHAHVPSLGKGKVQVQSGSKSSGLIPGWAQTTSRS